MRSIVLINTHPPMSMNPPVFGESTCRLYCPRRIRGQPGWMHVYARARSDRGMWQPYVWVARWGALDTREIRTAVAYWHFYTTTQTAEKPSPQPAKPVPWYTKIGRLCASLF